ncbi:hypothetical protein RL73_02470 [Liberibacter crescens]|nr:hypothetical protein RL73_02470 [Liberibacter crescens]
MLELSKNCLRINNGRTFISIEPVGDNGKEYCLTVIDEETGHVVNAFVPPDDLRAISTIIP